MLDKGGPSPPFLLSPALSASLPCSAPLHFLSSSSVFLSALQAAGMQSRSSTKASRRLCEEQKSVYVWLHAHTYTDEYGEGIAITSQIHSILQT